MFYSDGGDVDLAGDLPGHDCGNRVSVVCPCDDKLRAEKPNPRLLVAVLSLCRPFGHRGGSSLLHDQAPVRTSIKVPPITNPAIWRRAAAVCLGDAYCQGGESTRAEANFPGLPCECVGKFRQHAGNIDRWRLDPDHWPALGGRDDRSTVVGCDRP